MSDASPNVLDRQNQHIMRWNTPIVADSAPSQVANSLRSGGFTSDFCDQASATAWRLGLT